MCGILEAGVTVGHPEHRPSVRVSDELDVHASDRALSRVTEICLILLLLLLSDKWRETWTGMI